MAPSEESYRLIPLGAGLFAKVSDEDFEYLNQWKWRAAWNKPTRSFYAVRGERRQQIRMHRVVLGLKPGDKLRGDHINHDTLDNRRSNLRLATQQQNCWNRRNRLVNSSGVKGVSNDRGRWRARITIEGETKFLGSFRSVEEAQAAYCIAAKEAFGDFFFQ